VVGPPETVRRGHGLGGDGGGRGRELGGFFSSASLCKTTIKFEMRVEKRGLPLGGAEKEKGETVGGGQGMDDIWNVHPWYAQDKSELKA